MRKLNVRLLCEFLLWLLLALLAGVIGVKACHAQVDNLIYAKQFPGLTVAAKVTAAMATCNPGTGTTVPCIIVLDPSLAAYATGTLPTLCGHCYLWDWRDGPPGGAGSGITQLTGPVTAGPGSGSQPSAITAVNSDVGSCGDSTHVSQITLNAAGQATACIPVSISGGGGGSPTVLVTGGTVNCLTTACAGGSTYANNTTYTNQSTSAVFEEVSITATSGSPCAGADFSIVGSVNGATAAQNGITNACQGFAGIGFWVLPGQTLSALATHIDGGGAVSITQWYEFTPATTVTGGGGGSGSVSGQAAGVIPLATGPTAIGAQSHCDDGKTTAGVMTCSEPVATDAAGGGQTVFYGSVSGQTAIGAAAEAGSPAEILLPTANPSAPSLLEGLAPVGGQIPTQWVASPVATVSDSFAGSSLDSNFTAAFSTDYPTSCVSITSGQASNISGTCDSGANDGVYTYGAILVLNSYAQVFLNSVPGVSGAAGLALNWTGQTGYILVCTASGMAIKRVDGPGSYTTLVANGTGCFPSDEIYAYRIGGELVMKNAGTVLATSIDDFTYLGGEPGIVLAQISGAVSAFQAGNL